MIILNRKDEGGVALPVIDAPIKSINKNAGRDGTKKRHPIGDEVKLNKR